MVITDYTTATKTEITDEIVAEHRAAKIAAIEQQKRDDFYAARQVVIDDFNTAKEAEKNALMAIWQTAEDNDYTIPK